jgi:hypothetical protein
MKNSPAQVTKIEGIGDFVEVVKQYRPGQSRSNMPSIFRGVSSVEYELLPSAGRSIWPARHLYAGGQGMREKRAFDLWSDRCLAFLQQRPVHALESLLLAQHHGVPTRLLDWTYSPLVALFFALSGRSRDVDAAVYVGNAPPELRESPNRLEIERNPLNVDKHYLVMPPWTGARVSAQQSCFVLFPDPKIPLPLSNFRQLRIDKGLVGPMLRELHQLGVRSDTIFPDLDGLGRAITFEMFGEADQPPPIR